MLQEINLSYSLAKYLIRSRRRFKNIRLKLVPVIQLSELNLSGFKTNSILDWQPWLGF